MKRILNYPGSKWNIATQLVELIPDRDGTDRTVTFCLIYQK